MANLDDKYDAIIIGAGIGGLVCGCYLAKAGMKVLIVEKNDKPGGYCTSFKRDGFTFDACVHYLGSCREDGLLAGVIRDLGLEKKLELIHINPSDLIITPDYEIAFDNDIAKTIENFQRIFPKESKKIKEFFNIIIKGNFGWRYTFLKRKYTTFANLLNDYFDDYKLKCTLGTLMVNLGLSSNEVTPMAAITLYREFILDGGYYPKGGIQRLPDALVERFKKLGGEIILSHLAKKIKIKENKVEGVYLNNGSFILSNNVVSNADATKTFLELVGENHLHYEFVDNLKNKIPSFSMFIVYLGLNKKLNNRFKKGCAIWYVPTYDIDRYYFNVVHNQSINGPIFFTIPSLYETTLAPRNAESLRLMVGASFKDKNYWSKNKLDIANNIVMKRAEKIMPNLSEYVKVKEIATPQTLYKYTLNREGAVYGWSSILSQSDENINYKTPIKNLFLAGQWVSFFGIQGGISMVAFVGRNVSRSILGSYHREDR